MKGIHFEGLRVLGKPEQFAKFYYDNGADELFYQDVVASLYGRNSLLDIIKKTSREIFIPLCVGGGLRSIDDIRSVLRAGADKVAINTAAIKNPALIKEASRRFGSSAILISIEVIKKPDNSYEALINNGREKTRIEPFEWAKRVVDLGAGEVMVTSIDQEGTGKGFDLELTRKITESVPIPVIACGGAGKIEHIHDVILKSKADAVSIASIIHYDFIRNYDLEDDFSEEGNIEYLRNGKGNFLGIENTTLAKIKKYLIRHGIMCRQVLEGQVNA